MGKGGGGGGGPQQVTQTTTNLPEYAQPYFENIMQRAQAESYRPYTTYRGERLSEFTPQQLAAQAETTAMQTPGQIGVGSGLAALGGAAALGAGQYTPSEFAALMAQGPALTQYQMGAPEQFGEEQAIQYGSPFMQQVVEIQKRNAIADAQRAQLAQNLGAARQGTYGGARQLLAATEREKALGQQLGDIQATGLQKAYENAQQQFERDRAAQMMAGRENLGALLGVQQLGSQQSLQSQLANQQAMLEAQRAAEQSRQYGANLGLQGAQAATQAGQILGQLGTAQQATDLQRLQAQAAVGAEQRALQQQRLDMAYSDFLRQRDYPMEQLGYYSNLLRGLPIQLGSTATTYAQPPSIASQVGGLGLAGLGLYNLTKGA